MADGAVGGLAVSWWDRLLIGIAPEWGLRRVRARASVQLLARHYEAAQGGRRTSGWRRTASDANVANGPALAALRELSRDLLRNNGWAENAIRTIVHNTVGWGILPKPEDRSRARGKAALRIWNAWANSKACDFDGRLNFYGLQQLAMETVALSGEVLIVRQPAANADALPIPMRVQVLEPDYLDMSRNGMIGPSGGQIIQGIEFDKQGRRTAYWLFTAHPGSAAMNSRFESVRTPADRVLHIYRVDRPGQVRGVPWLASAITRLKDFDDFEDAELMQQKVAACFGAFVTDMESPATPIGAPGTANNGDDLDQLEPGHIAYLKPGQTVVFAQPPRAQDSGFSVRTLRRIAAGVGVTYEDISGDYSQVNFSSARMARLKHWQSVHGWRWHMLIPQLCDGVWRWAMELAMAVNGWPAVPGAQWAAPPMPILEPDKEGLAYQRLVRIGAMTWPQMIRELGEDPVAQLDEIERFNQEMDERGIVLDCDPRRTNANGGVQIAGAPNASGDVDADENGEDEEDVKGDDEEEGDGDTAGSQDAEDPEADEDDKAGADGAAGASAG